MHAAEYIEIPLYDRHGAVWGHARIDAVDARLAEHRWSRAGGGYLSRQTPRRAGSPLRSVYLHREVLGLTSGDGLEGDHINHDKLDNRRSNLRVVTSGQNGHNRPATGGSSRYRGVSWARIPGKWRATSKLHGRTVVIGMFDDELVAARAARAFRLDHMSHTVEEVL